MKVTCTGCGASIEVRTDYQDPFCSSDCLSSFFKRIERAEHSDEDLAIFLQMSWPAHLRTAKRTPRD